MSTRQPTKRKVLSEKSSWTENSGLALDHIPRILALDGGGVRGLSSLLILERLMKEVQRLREEESDPTPDRKPPRPCQYFDLICGTSTGGLIAIMLGRLRMPVDVCIQKYLEFSKAVFRLDHMMVVPVGEGYSRFSAEPLEKALKKIVFDETHNEDTPLADERDQICPVFVLSTRGKDAGPVKLFRSYGFYKDECPIWQAARATTAAPTYFPPAWVTVPYPPESYVDGGVTQNNPSPLALKEGRDMWKAKRCILVSVGTGIQKRADLVGNQRTPQDDLELMDDSLTSSSQLESGHTPENISSPGSTNRHRLKGGMKLGLGKAATMVGGAFQEFASTIRPMTDKVAEFGRFPGGLSTAVQFLKELVKLSTQSEKTHGEVYAEAHSRDLSAQFPYYRFNVQNGLDDIGLEEWQNWNLMVSLTRNYLDSADVSPRLTECAGDLLHPPRFVSLPLSCFMVRYERNHSFTGRDIFLEQLHNKFHHSTDHYHGRIALFGLGGIGKSEIALEYVYRYQSSYQRIYWISADTQASLLGGYKKIAERAELQTVHLSTRAEIAEDVISWLEQEESWLLVVDNLDNIEVLSMPEKPNSKFLLLPSTGQLRQHTLITTRNRHASGIPAQGMEVDKFGQQDSLRLLYKSSKITSLSDSTEDQAAARIVEDLDHLPLAIDHAAAYIREVAKKFSAFLTDYTRYRRELLNWTPQRLEAYQYTVATTWRMSFAAISVNNPMAVELLRLLSFLNPDGVFIEFLQDGAKAIPDNLQQIISHRIRLYKALLELEKFSLIKRAVHFEGKDILVIHRLVQTVVKDEMPGSELMGFRTTIVNLCNQAFPEEWNEKTWALCRLYVGQVIGPLMDPGVLEGEKFANIVNVMHRVASFLRDDGNAVDSERLLAQLLEYSKRIFGEEHPDTLTIMGNLAIRFHDQGKMVEAVALQEKVLKKQKEILRAEHPNTLTLMNNLASMYLTQDKMKAATMQEEVLMKFGRIRGSEHTDTLKSMGNLAYMYQVQGKMVEAEALQEKVLEKVEGILGADHPDTLTSMDNLASTYEAQGNIEKAAALQYEVLERRKRILGAEHLDTLRSMESLVRMYLAQGKMEEAMLLAREWREKSSKLRLENATKLKELGNVAFKAQNFDLAVEKYEEGLKYVDEREGDSSEDLHKLKALCIQLCLNLVLVQLKTSQFSNAVKGASFVLELEGLSDLCKAKAFYRRGVAYLKNGEEDLAADDLKSALELSPSDETIVNELNVATARQKLRREKEKKAYCKMFS